MLVNVTIPVYNEETQLADSVAKLWRFLREHCRFEFEIIVANNASTDRTRQVAEGLCRAYPSVNFVDLREKGRGRAVKKVWNEASASVLSYMDVDLSADLAAFPPMIEALASGGFDLATGSRLLKPSLTNRGFKRELISRCYNLLVKLQFHTQFSDAQCGFKAITKRAATELLPLVEDNGWFMDTELLVIAEKLGYRIFDLPVRWTDDSDSRVKIWSTAIGDIEGIARLRRNFAAGRYCGSANERRSAATAVTSGESIFTTR
jgi:glycosyltransferase involved in cell wall biosynthesis